MRKLGAYRTYLLIEGGIGLFFSTAATLDLVYQVEIAHLNPLQLVLVGTALEISAFTFEVPTGIVADMYSRRHSIIIGMLLWGLGFVVEGSFPRFEIILLAQMIWGLGYTFTSGATEAWISDEIGEAKAGKAFLRASQVSQVAALVGIGVSVAVAQISLQAPVIVAGVLIMVLGVVLLIWMPEHKFVPAPRENRNSWQQMGHTLRGGLGMIERRPVLVTILLTAAVYGAFSEGYDRLFTPHLIDNFTLPAVGPLGPETWFGILRAAGLLLSLGAIEFARRRVDTNDNKSTARALFVINALLVLAVVGFGTATDIRIAFVGMLVIIPLRRIIEPIQTAWVNQRLDSQLRATMISMSAQADALGQIIGGPILGAIATLVSTRVEMVAAAVVLSPILLLYIWAMCHSNEMPVVVEIAPET